MNLRKLAGSLPAFLCAILATACGPETTSGRAPGPQTGATPVVARTTQPALAGEWRVGADMAQNPSTNLLGVSLQGSPRALVRYEHRAWIVSQVGPTYVEMRMANASGTRARCDQAGPTRLDCQMNTSEGGYFTFPMHRQEQVSGDDAARGQAWFRQVVRLGSNWRRLPDVISTANTRNLRIEPDAQMPGGYRAVLVHVRQGGEMVGTFVGITSDGKARFRVDDRQSFTCGLVGALLGCTVTYTGGTFEFPFEIGT